MHELTRTRTCHSGQSLWTAPLDENGNPEPYAVEGSSSEEEETETEEEDEEEGTDEEEE